MPVGLSGAAIDDFSTRFRFTKGIRASVDRIAQNLPDGVVNRQPPENLLPRSLELLRQFDFFTSKPQQRLPSAPQLFELCKDQINCLFHAAVGIDFDLTAG